jgi:hypothetical protein
VPLHGLLICVAPVGPNAIAHLSSCPELWIVACACCCRPFPSSLQDPAHDVVPLPSRHFTSSHIIILVVCMFRVWGLVVTFGGCAVAVGSMFSVVCFLACLHARRLFVWLLAWMVGRSWSIWLAFVLVLLVALVVLMFVSELVW